MISLKKSLIRIRKKKINQIYKKKERLLYKISQNIFTNYATNGKTKYKALISIKIIRIPFAKVNNYHRNHMKLNSFFWSQKRICSEILLFSCLSKKSVLSN